MCCSGFERRVALVVSALVTVWLTPSAAAAQRAYGVRTRAAQRQHRRLREPGGPTRCPPRSAWTRAR